MRQRGFTLIEVVAALAIGAGSIAALLPIFSDGARRADRAAEARLALMVAQSALASASAEPALRPGAAWDGAAYGLVWRVAVEDWGGGAARQRPGAPAVALRRVSVGVWRGVPEGAPLASLQTLRLVNLVPLVRAGG